MACLMSFILLPPILLLSSSLIWRWPLWSSESQCFPTKPMWFTLLLETSCLEIIRWTSVSHFLGHPAISFICLFIVYNSVFPLECKLLRAEDLCASHSQVYTYCKDIAEWMNEEYMNREMVTIFPQLSFTRSLMTLQIMP